MQYDGPRATAPEIGFDYYCRIGLTMNTATDRFQDARRCGGKRYAGADGGPAQDAVAKRRAVPQTFRQTPPTSHGLPGHEDLFSGCLSEQHLRQQAPAARWTKCRQQRISYITGSSAETVSSRHIWQKQVDVMPVTSTCDSTIGIPIWGRLQEMRGRLETARHTTDDPQQYSSPGANLKVENRAGAGSREDRE